MKKDNLEVLPEDIRGKFDLVLEGHDVLHKEIVDTRHELRGELDVVNLKIEALSEKIDGVALDLKAHRADTEVHKKVYKVNEP